MDLPVPSEDGPKTHGMRLKLVIFSYQYIFPYQYISPSVAATPKQKPDIWTAI